MRFLFSILLIALLAFAAGIYLPWWSVAIAAFIVAVVIPQSPGLSFLAGFSGVLLLWLVLSWSITSSNDHVLAAKIARILPLNGSVLLLVIITSLIGGIIGGLAALTGSLLRKIR
ncbi:MAG: hypothetical protein J7497_09920 [Chitinophagaceae bacterium]|nr:hypothetical protein [Chitinophagaceae bacterium]